MASQSMNTLEFTTGRTGQYKARGLSVVTINKLGAWIQKAINARGDAVPIPNDLILEIFQEQVSTSYFETHDPLFCGGYNGVALNVEGALMSLLFSGRLRSHNFHLVLSHDLISGTAIRKCLKVLQVASSRLLLGQFLSPTRKDCRNSYSAWFGSKAFSMRLQWFT